MWRILLGCLMATGFASAQTSVTLAWNPNAEPDVTGYRLHFGTSSSSLSETRSVGNVTATELTGLAPSTTYFAAVQALNSAGQESPMSSQISFTTRAIAEPEIVVSDAEGNEIFGNGDPVSSGPVPIGESGVPMEFRISNSGGGNLTGLSFGITGSHAGDFKVTPSAATSLTPGSGDEFTVAFTPTAEGIRYATLSIASNDADENPYLIPLQGIGTLDFVTPVPGISVSLAGGATFSHGSASFGFAAPLAPAQTSVQEFILTSTGNTALGGLAVSLAGSHASDFSLSSAVPATLGSGESVSLTVSFKPGASGARSAVLRILSNDGEHSPFDINLTGPGLAMPEIAVELANGTGLTDGVSSVDFGPSNLGATGVSNSIVVRSTGSADLTGLSLSLAGTNPGDFTVSSLPASLAPGGSASFAVSFSPLAAGSRGAILRITSNDGDENPFDITLSGTGVAVPEIAVELANGTNLTDGVSGVAFGSSNLGSSGVSNSLVIRSIGSANLTGLSLSLAGTNPGDFTVSSIPTSIAAGGNTSFTVTFKPLAAGSRSAILRVASNDADENPFDITLSGTGVAVPEIHMELANGTALADGVGSVAFGSSNLGSSGVSNSFVIRSTGSANLTGLSLSLVGTNPGDFTVSSIPTSIAAGGNTSFTVTFKPLVAGSRSAILRVASNDADENPYDITLSGTGVAVPEIHMELANGIGLADGVGSVAFGSSILGSSGVTNSLVIRSTGSANLTGLSLSLAGTNPGDFTVSSIPTSIAAGGNTAFTVAFKPLAAGSRSAILRVASNDADENPYDITLTGTGVAVPEIAVSGPNGWDLKSSTSVIAFGSQELLSSGETLAFAIHNSGSASLSGIKLSLTGSHAADFSIRTSPASSVAPGASSAFSVTFRPNAAGGRSAQLHITSNDADENPFVITLTGNATATPDIGITHADGITDAVAAGTLHFGVIDLGSAAAEKQLLLRNYGNGALQQVSLRVDGAHAADFTVAGLASPAVAPGVEVPLTIRFNPLAGGPRSAVLTVSSNDPDEGTIRIPLAGAALTYPEIVVADTQAGILTNGVASLDFGKAAVRQTGASRVFVIRNTGNRVLARLNAFVEGAGAREFRIIKPLPASIAPGDSALIRVEFSPADSGRRSATLRIDSNDADDSSFAITLTGAGIPVPRIEVRSSGMGELKDGDSVVTFGAAGRSSRRTITIINRGSAPLAGIVPSLSGPHASDFRISGNVAGTLAPGKSASFRIDFDPSGKGLRWGALRIISNDPSTRVFDIILSGRNGIQSAKRKSTAKKAVVERAAPPVVSTINLGGERFRCITVVKSAHSSVALSDIQVSGNLVDWKSGHRHVVIVTDNASILKVRDAIPLKPGTKRHIRLKPGSGRM